AAGGTSLRNLAAYEALMVHTRARDAHAYGWQQWPADLQDPTGFAVDAFARAQAHEVEFYAFAQWLADTQLTGVANRAAGMPIGLYRDLAVGVEPNSAEVWSDRESYCLGVCVGAPPDPMNLLGQNWGFAPFDPQTLRARAYAPYIALLRANMRHAGALRIDHVMGLMRLFCIPAGAPSSDGTYVGYHFDEMLGILALESRRHRCMIVGEDLGTVPEGFRARLEAAGILGCRLLYFEREADGKFRPPERYDEQAVASTGTHDLAPLAGFWAGSDLLERSRLHFFPDAERAAAAFDERAHARKLLLSVLLAHKFLGMDDATSLEHALDSASNQLVFSLVLAAYQLLGRSKARLLLVQLEDAFLLREQVNTPGTFDEVPNWRRRLPLTVDAFREDDRLRQLLQVVDASRAAR
ncbi:MAG: 4-alpha-glucanotransferase, partial [Candidatus Eremiobacteraeota bacterium]|nr:4-alpha-glucanotransferase [Candidatus Eremiobacteraeota bacterium]